MAIVDLNLDFMGFRKVAAVASILLVTVSLISLATNQVEWGLDFTGGNLVEVAYDKSVDPEAIREELTQAGYTGQVVQYFGSDREILIRMPPQPQLDARENAHLGDRKLESLRESGAEVEMRRSEFVGPAVGQELTNQGGFGLMTALGAVLLYVAFRFQLKFGLGAVVALFHDVLITLGIFSIARWNFDLTVLAALLAVIGYSLNDTIVVSDRIRENFRKVRRTKPIDIINISLNQTLGRTLVTSLTTLLVLFTLLLLGGELNWGIATALIIGVVVGTYSSIYVASNILLLLNVNQGRLGAAGEGRGERPGYDGLAAGVASRGLFKSKKPKKSKMTFHQAGYPLEALGRSGNHLAALHVIDTTGKVAHQTAGFNHQQSAGCQIPPAQAVHPEDIQPASRNPRQAQARNCRIVA